MRVLLLVKHSEKKIIMSMYFKNEIQAISWWVNLPCSEEWEIIYEGERKKSGHRYEVEYSKPDEQGKIYSKYAICFLKKEAAILAKKIEEANLNYTVNIKKLY